MAARINKNVRGLLKSLALLAGIIGLVFALAWFVPSQVRAVIVPWLEVAMSVIAVVFIARSLRQRWRTRHAGLLLDLGRYADTIMPIALGLMLLFLGLATMHTFGDGQEANFLRAGYQVFWGFFLLDSGLFGRSKISAAGIHHVSQFYAWERLESYDLFLIPEPTLIVRIRQFRGGIRELRLSLTPEQWRAAEGVLAERAGQKS